MKKKPALLKCVAILFFLVIASVSFSQNNIQVTGQVRDQAGKPVPGVTVMVKGTTTATATKPDGSFEINAPSEKSTLVFSSVGFAEQQVPVNGTNRIDVTMVTASSMMEDVVVVGYGTQKKTDLTGSISHVTAAQIQERPAQNVLQAIQGKTPGVQVSTNFKPGELPVVRIRGYRSLSASNDPLYVIDGIPLVNALGVNSFTMSDLNPNDIVSIDILKDASATAIYGSRGANGVVLITTKKGQKGRVAVTLASTISLDSYKSLTDWMDGSDYIDRWRLSLMNGRLYQSTTNTNLNQPATIWYPDPFLDRDKMALATDPTVLKNIWGAYDWDVYGVTPKMRATTAAEQAMGWPAMVPVYDSRRIKSYDWLDASVRQGVSQNHQLSVSAGNETSRLSMSLGYYNQLGVQRDQNYKRYNVNISGDITPTKWFALGTSIISSFSLQNFGIQGPNTSNTGSKDLYSRASDQFPYAFPNDSVGNAIKNPGGNLSLWNPLIDITQSINERRTAAVLASIYSEIKFTPWLRYRVNFGAQYRHFRSGTWTGPDATSHLTNKPNTAGYAVEENSSWVVENLLYFDKTFAKIHKLGVTLLQSAQKSRKENTSTSVSGNINPLSLWYDLGSNTVGNPGGYGTGFTENTLTSFMGRVNYGLMDKYLLTASGRYDGSSVLAPGHKWNFFQSAALAWKMQEEEFIKSISWVNELKLRIGYGVVGNSSVAPYSSTGPLSRNPYVWGSAAAIGFLPQTVQNPELKWERTAETNLGLDFGVLKGRINGTIEVYQQNTSDLLMPKTLPAVSGYVQKIENIGKTRNRGIELNIISINIDKKDFTWTTDINWSRNKEEIVELLNGKQDMIASGYFIGQPSQVFYQYQNAGIWGSDPKDIAEMALFNANGHKFYPGTVKVVDQNGDHKINASDFVVLGSPRPKWSGGITTTFRYKNWSLSSFIYFRWGQTYFGGYPNSYGGANPNGRVENDLWSWTNTAGRWPMPNFGNVENITSAMQYNDGSFGAVRNISLSYTLPKKWLQKATLSSLVLNAQIINPFIFGPGVVKWGINPDDDTNWSIASSNTNPLGGTNNNTILPQSIVFSLRAGF